jgi:hypothetical protein
VVEALNDLIGHDDQKKGIVVFLALVQFCTFLGSFGSCDVAGLGF